MNQKGMLRHATKFLLPLSCLSLLAINQCDDGGSSLVEVGWTADMVEYYHNASGLATIVSERQIIIEHFYYDGGGPDVKVWVSVDGNYNSDGYAVTDHISGASYEDATLEISLPDDLTLEDFNHIGVYCEAFNEVFSDGEFVAPAQN